MKNRSNVLRESCKRTSLDRFHNNNRNPKLFGKKITLHARLLINIHIVQLDLAEIPLAVFDDFFKYRIVIVEGESEVPDTSLCLELLAIFYDAKIHHFFPGFLAE